MDGAREVDDEELQLLRHNFAVLALAKHYLSVDSGAETPEEDALYHLLGAGLAQRVLKLARGGARDTLCVKPVEVEPPVAVAGKGLALGAGSAPMTNASAKPRVIARLVPRSAVHSQPAPDALPSVSSEWGLAADSPVVLSNPGMFYRDGNGRTRPYTWAEFMEHFARRVKAKRQPALVRAKYGVGFALNGGDMPERTFSPKKAVKPAAYHHSNLGAVLVPEALLLGPLSRALHDFRRKVGKEEPDDPAHADLLMLMPAERVALQIYDQRLARYAALQATQHDSLSHAPDLDTIPERPGWQQRFAAPYIAELQEAFGALGLLEQPKKKPSMPGKPQSIGNCSYVRAGAIKSGRSKACLVHAHRSQETRWR
jgi:hypothetical protein